MKKIYLFTFLILIVATRLFAQKTSAFHLNKLSKKDTLLSGWTFRAGDNNDWSKPEYDDSKWKSVNPGQDIERFSPLHKSGIGWLRLHLDLDTAISKQQFGAYIIQYVASDVYLNGKLLRKYGVVNADRSKVVAYLPSAQPFNIKLKTGADNVLAIRLAYQSGVPYGSIFYTALPVLNMYINNQQTALLNYSNNQHRIATYVLIFSIAGGILLIIGFIYLVYFLFDRSQKVYLYYSLFTLALSVSSLPIEAWGIDRFGTVSSQMWAFFVEGEALIFGMLFMLMTVYKLFGYPHRTIFKVLVLFGVVIGVSLYLYGTWGQFAVNAYFPVICLLEGSYVCIWAAKRHKKDAGIILAGIFLFILSTVLYALINADSVLAQLLFNFGQLFFPVGMSFYFGIQNAVTNKKLRITLEEVQTLSAQKQQILAAQNEFLEKQVDERTTELRQSLADLEATQTQLIQKEKMASLGELTAGIAHEIQNPLNFVNNFSEVSIELLQELKEEEEAGNKEDVIAIADNLAQNLQKINHHGKRADAIVKGMLEHSKVGTGKKQLTDLNALADEFLKLSYHGMQAKDKNYNAVPIAIGMVTHFDEKLPKANVSQQDIGRVMLNLFNNAFYAVNQKLQTAGPDYRPMVEVSTSAKDGAVEIIVKDNGNGIPDSIKDKIMQPFFTTKPTGEGTGLGLSLSYDIVVKGHGGSITVDTREGEFTEFTVILPLQGT